MTIAGLSKTYGVHPTQIGTCKRAAINNKAVEFSKRGGDLAQVDDATTDRLRFKIGQSVVDRDFLKRAWDR